MMEHLVIHMILARFGSTTYQRYTCAVEVNGQSNLYQQQNAKIQSLVVGVRRHSCKYVYRTAYLIDGMVRR
jgi:hypothetical protein